MTALQNNFFKKTFKGILKRKIFFKWLISILITDLSGLAICLFINNIHASYIVTLSFIIALIKVKITFSFNTDLSFSKYLSKLGYIAFFFLYFWGLSFAELRQVSHIFPYPSFSYILIFFILLLFNLIPIGGFKWIQKSKPWVHLFIDLLSLTILIPVCYLNNLADFLITPFVLTLIVIRYLCYVKLSTKTLSFFSNKECLIFGEVISFYLFLAVLIAAIDNFNYEITYLLAVICIYILVLFLRMFLFTKYSFEKKDIKSILIIGTILIPTLSLIAFLLFILPGEKGTNIITFILPTIIPIIFQNTSMKKRLKHTITPLKSFQSLKIFLNTLFFYSTISINILANLVSTKTSLPLPVNTLENFTDYMDLVMYSIMLSVLLTALSLLVYEKSLEKFFEVPKNSFMKIVPNNRRFPKRLRK